MKFFSVAMKINTAEKEMNIGIAISPSEPYTARRRVCGLLKEIFWTRFNNHQMFSLSQIS